MLLPLFLPMVLTSYTTVPTPTADYNLKSVHVVFRHGDSEFETPNIFSNYTDEPHEFDPRAEANLTKIGRMRAYKLGQYLRSRYSDFLGEEYRREDVYARSTYPERTRASLLLVLAGLYPPEAQERWHPTLDWQPISIESPEDQTNDPLMWPIDCSAYLEERENVESTPEFMAATASLVDFFVQLANYTSSGEEVNETDITDLYMNLRVSTDGDVSMPDWDDDEISKKIIRNAAVLRYHAQNYNERLRRLNGGMLLKKIVDDMSAMVMGEEKPKINLYGGQEFNVVGLLWALDAWKPIVPTYSTAVIVELWEKDSKYYVKVLYHDGLTGETESRTVEGCEKMCPFDKFLALHQQVLPLDVNECYTDIDSRKQCYKQE